TAWRGESGANARGDGCAGAPDVSCARGDANLGWGDGGGAADRIGALTGPRGWRACPRAVSSSPALRRLALSGCRSAALVCQDGGVLVLCGSSLIRWHESRLQAIARDFDDGTVLLAGPEGEPWVLSGSGVTLGVGE